MLSIRAGGHVWQPHRREPHRCGHGGGLCRERAGLPLYHHEGGSWRFETGHGGHEGDEYAGGQPDHPVQGGGSGPHGRAVPGGGDYRGHQSGGEPGRPALGGEHGRQGAAGLLPQRGNRCGGENYPGAGRGRRVPGDLRGVRAGRGAEDYGGQHRPGAGVGAGGADPAADRRSERVRLLERSCGSAGGYGHPGQRHVRGAVPQRPGKAGRGLRFHPPRHGGQRCDLQRPAHPVLE